jgi:hypothetical protein
MAADDVFSAEMPDHPIPPLDDDTAERLLSGRLDPDDAPPAYAGVARLLRAAAAPAGPDELSGQDAALASFRAAQVGIGDAGGQAGSRGRPVGVRGRVVAVALAGVLVVGGAVAGGAAAAGLWATGDVPSSGRLRSPTGGPGAGEAGSGAPGAGVGTGPGLLRPAGSAAVTESERAVARHAGGGGSRGGGAAHGVKPVRTPEAKAGNAEAAKPTKPGAEKPQAEKPHAGNQQTDKPHAGKPEPKGPKAAPGQGADHAGSQGADHAGARQK